MKKLVLLSLFFVGFSAQRSLAQSFTVSHDTAKAVVSGTSNIYNELINNSSSPVSITWRVTSHTVPASWSNSIGICDNVTCYSTNILNGDANTTDPIPANSKGDFHIQMDASSLPSGGPYYINIEAKDASGATVKNFAFELMKFPTNVATVSKVEDITVYPNPARDEVNVIFNANAGIKNIAVYNLIGKPVMVYKVSGNSAKLNIESIPSGIYFLRMVDGQGHVITRKFTHQ
jgi:hypothetical protein